MGLYSVKQAISLLLVIQTVNQKDRVGSIFGERGRIGEIER